MDVYFNTSWTWSVIFQFIRIFTTTAFTLSTFSRSILYYFFFFFEIYKLRTFTLVMIPPCSEHSVNTPTPDGIRCWASRLPYGSMLEFLIQARWPLTIGSPFRCTWLNSLFFFLDKSELDKYDSSGLKVATRLNNIMLNLTLRGSFGSQEKEGGKCGQRESNEMPLVWLEFSKERDGKVVFSWDYDSHVSWKSYFPMRRESLYFYFFSKKAL